MDFEVQLFSLFFSLISNAVFFFSAGFFRGLPALIYGAAPAHAVFFGMYEFTKHNLGGNMAGHHPVEVALAGVCATVAMDAVLTPMDAVKQRMQLSSANYSGFLDCIKKVGAKDGFRSLYAGYGTTLVMNVPFNTVFFLSYETAKKVSISQLSAHEDSVGLHLTCGALAGVSAAAVTNPFDVAKTRLQTMHDTGKRYKGMVDALGRISAEEGVAGLFKGLKPRMILHSTSSAIVWACYEYMKRLLSNGGEDPPLTFEKHIGHAL
jgi:solute carrier family 25 iron transporter 28/37